MRIAKKRAFGMFALLSLSAAVACGTSHKLEPPNGLTAGNAGDAGDSLAGDAEAGAGQYSGGSAGTFAPQSFAGGVGASPLSRALMPAMARFVAYANATATAATDPTATETVSPTPTPSAPPTLTPPPSGTTTPTPAPCNVAGQLAGATDVDADTFPENIPPIDLSTPCEMTTGIGPAAVAGTIEIADDSTAAVFAFHRIVDLGIANDVVSGTFQSTVTGTDPQDGTYHLNQNETFAVDGSGIHVRDQLDWAETYTPSQGASWTAPWTPLPGTLAVDGAWSIEMNAGAAGASVSTPTPLTITPSCATRVTAGVLSATVHNPDGSSHTLSVTWTACGAHTTSFDGQPVN